MRALLATMLLASPALAAADAYVEGGWEPLGEVALEKTEVAREVGSPEPLALGKIPSPAITENRYLVAGEVRYTDASGFLEMWNQFGDARYFTRTMGEFGPMAKLEGSSDWRRFMLPFNATNGELPDLLEINVVLPGGGSVEVRGLKLYQTDAKLAALPGSLSADKRWGLVFAGIALAVTVIVWIGCVRRRRAERELRKLKAADLGS